MTQIADDQALLSRVTQAVERVGRQLLERFCTTPAPTTLSDLLAGIDANDAAVEATLRDTLLTTRPGSRWAADEEDEGALPAGEWWVVDPAEGNVNHLHGRAGWGVTATLVRDGEPVLTAANLPLTQETYSALVGQGAFVNGQRLHVSAKQELGAAIVASGQASPGETKAIRAAMLRSAGALLDAALLVRLSVPTTLELVDVAAGRLDAFWQHGRVRAGLIGGALLVREAGGLVSDLAGGRWTAASPDFLACPPGLAPAFLSVLSSTSEFHA
jgi:myo-inositol-1(or 4)-monophosphatase